MQDQVTLVNEQDEFIGVMDKYEAHRHPAKLHRAVSVFLFNKDGELLIQQRSDKKIVGAGQWANTCCGNVWPGESYEECALRRLNEELKIKNVKIQPIYKFQYAVQCNEEYGEHEMDQVFVGSYDGKVQPNPEEVADYAWLPWEQLIRGGKYTLEVESYTWAPWFEIMMKNNDLRIMIQEYVLQ